MTEEQANLLHQPMTTISAQFNTNENPSSLLMRLESTSTMIKEEQQIFLDSAVRTLFKSTSRFNRDFESGGDELSEFLTSNNEFQFHRFLSDLNGNEIRIDMDDTLKFDAIKNSETRILTDFFAGDSFDQINPSSITENLENATNQIDFQLNEMKTLPSFTELCPPTPDFVNGELFQIDANDFKSEFESPSIFTEMNPFDQSSYTPPSSTTVLTHFNFDSPTVSNHEHDYDSPAKSTSTPTPTPTTSKRTITRGQRRTSSRLQSRAKIVNFQHLLNNDDDDDSCSSSIISNRRTKRCPSVSRIAEVKSEEDLSYYLERRRRNNEASKMSRAARKQKFDHMDFRCSEYERLNNELRLKLSTLEIVVSSLRHGLIHSFRKDQSTSEL